MLTPLLLPPCALNQMIAPLTETLMLKTFERIRKYVAIESSHFLGGSGNLKKNKNNNTHTLANTYGTPSQPKDRRIVSVEKKAT